MSRRFAPVLPSPRLVIAASSLGPESDEVVRAALAIARAAGGRLFVLHALEPAVATAPAGLLAFGLVRDGLVAKARERVEAQLRRLGAADSEVAGIGVEVGRASDLLAAAAERLSANLLVVGAAAAHASPLRRTGSTAMRVLRAALQPVLVVKGALEVPPARVLAPVDLSDTSVDSLRCGLALLAATATGSPPTVIATHVDRDETPAPAEVEENVLELVAGGVSDYPGVVHVCVRSGEPASEIVAAAGLERADLIVIGTHGCTGWRRLSLGSVAESVVRESAVSVLVVPPAAALAGAIAEAVVAGTAGVA